MAEQTAVIRLEITAGGAVRVLSDVAGKLDQLGQRGKASADALAGSFGQVTSSLQKILQIAAGINLANLFQAAVSQLQALATHAISFSAGLESSRLTIASLLQGTTTLTTAAGKTVDATTAWTINLKEAAALQEQIAEMSATTLGTQEELLSVFRGVLAFGRGQTATLQEQLQVSQGLLNVGKLQGLNAALLEAEVRQIFTLESARGQVILPLLGITIDQARAYKEQGTWVQHLNEALAVYNQLASSAALTWQGLTTTVETFANLLTATTFSDIFTGLKAGLLGFRDEIIKLNSDPNLRVQLQVDETALQQAGAFAADMFAAIVRGAAEATVEVIRLTTAFAVFVQALEDTKLAEVGGDIKTVLGGGFTFLAALWQEEIIPLARDLIQLFVTLEQIIAGFARLFAQLDFSSPLAAAQSLVKAWEGSADVFARAMIAGRQAGAEFEVAQLKAGDAAQQTGSRISLLGVVFKTASDAAFIHAGAVSELTGHYVRNSVALEQSAAAAQKAAEAHAKAAKAVADAAKANADYLTTVADMVQTEDALTVAHQARVTAIEKATAAEIARGKAIQDAGASTAAVLAAEQTGQANLFKEELQNTKDHIALIAQRTTALKDAATAAAAYESKHIELQTQAIEAERGRIAAEKELAQARGASAQELFGFTQQDLAQQRALLDIRRQRLQNEIASSQIELTLLQNQRDEQQQQIANTVALAQAQGTLGSPAVIASLTALQDSLVKTSSQIVTQTGNIEDLQAQYAAAGVEVGTLSTKTQTAFQEMQNAGAQIHLGDIITQGIQGLAQGTLQLGNFLKQQGQALIAQFAESFLLGKREKLDIPFGANVMGLVGPGGLIGDLFGAGGSLAASLFGAGFMENAPGLGNLLRQGEQIAIDTSQVVWSSGGQSSGGSFLTSLGTTVLGGVDKIFGTNLQNSIGSSLGTIGKSLGAGLAGQFLGDLASGLFGINKSQQAQIGGKVGSAVGGIAGFAIGSALGGPVLGTFLGSFGGDILGSLFGGLFAHVPTKGTQIRQGVVQWLHDIHSAYADISSKEYFFEETKALANKMFGGDFLAASKKILTDTAGPELARQLQALGTFVTADQAKKLGKPVEQTGTTFGNMLLDNLGVEKIPAVIKDIVSKANINLAGLVTSLNDLFKSSRISQDYYQQTILGAVSIFTTDLPDAIKHTIDSVEELQQFFKDGVFDLQAFQDNIKAQMTAFQSIGEAFTTALSDGITNAQSKTQVEDAFQELLQESIRKQLVDKFIADNVTDLFKDIDLSKPLDASSEAMKTLRDRTGDMYDKLIAVLDAAGVLPAAFKKAADAAQPPDFAQQAKDATDKALAAAGDFGSAVSQAVSDGLKKGAEAGATEADVAAAFQTSLNTAIADSITNAVIQGFVNAALAEGALGPALKQITDLINQFIASNISFDTFSQGVTDAFASAQPMINRLAESLGVASGKLNELLQNAGILPKTLNESADAAATVTTQYVAQGQAIWDSQQAMLANTTTLQEASDAAAPLSGHTTDAGEAAANMSDQLTAALRQLGLLDPATAKVSTQMDDAQKATQEMVAHTTEATTQVTGMDDQLRDALKQLGFVSDSTTDVSTGMEEVKNKTQSYVALLWSGVDALKEMAHLTGSVTVPSVPTAVGHAQGGLVLGTGTGDTVPALLTPGEFVVTAEAARKHLAMLAQLNTGRNFYRYQEGGAVGHPTHFARPWADAERARQLQAEKDAIRGITQSANAASDGLDKVSAAFANAAKSISQILTQLTTTTAAGLSPTQAYAQSQVQAAALRQQIASSTGEAQAQFMQDLAQLLQQQLDPLAQLFAPTDQRFINAREQILTELQGLQTQAEKQTALLAQATNTPTTPHVSAQGGYRGWLAQDTTIQAHRGEFVNVIPAGVASSAAPLSITINIPLTMNISLNGSGDAEAFAQQISAAVLRQIEANKGKIGNLILQGPAGKTFTENLRRGVR